MHCKFRSDAANEAWRPWWAGYPALHCNFSPGTDEKTRVCCCPAAVTSVFTDFSKVAGTYDSSSAQGRYLLLPPAHNPGQVLSTKVLRGGLLCVFELVCQAPFRFAQATANSGPGVVSVGPKSIFIGRSVEKGALFLACGLIGHLVALRRSTTEVWAASPAPFEGEEGNQPTLKIISLRLIR